MASSPSTSAPASTEAYGSVNTNPNESSDVTINIAGQKISGVNGQVLTAAAMDAHNTFTQKDVVKPAPFAARASKGELRLKIPAKAVVVVAIL